MEVSSSGVSGSASAGSAPTPSSVSSAPSNVPSSSSPPASSDGSASGSTDGLPTPQSVGGPGSQQPAGEDASGKLPGETAQQAAERKLKLKVNGREQELTEAEVIRRAQLASAADEKFRKAAEIQKQHDAFLEALKADPFGALEQHLKDSGLDLDALSEQRLVAKLQKEMMDPRDVELEELRAFKQKQEEAQEAAAQEQMTRQQQQAFQEMQQRATQQFDQQMTEALSASDLPKDPEAVKDIARLMYEAMEKGYEIDPRTAVDMVRERYSNTLQSLTSRLEGESLVKFLGDDLVKKLRKHDLAVLKAKMGQPSQAQTPLAPPSQPRREPGEEKLSMAEWIERARQKAGV